MSKNISPDSVRSGRTCPANLGVRSCLVRKVLSSPKIYPSDLPVVYKVRNVYKSDLSVLFKVKNLSVLSMEQNFF